MWFAVQVADHCCYGPVSRDLKLRSHPDTLAKTFPTEALREYVLSNTGLFAVETALSKIRAELDGTFDTRKLREAALEKCTNLVCMK